MSHPDGRNRLRFDGAVELSPVDLERGPRADAHLQAALDELDIADR